MKNIQKLFLRRKLENLGLLENFSPKGVVFLLSINLKNQRRRQDGGVFILVFFARLAVGF